MIRVEPLRFRYKNDAPVLEDVSFTLAAGESLCPLGPNGTGKTTTCANLGLNRPAPA